MLQTAEQVAKRYKIPRERQDEYGARSQQRAPPRRPPASSTTRSCRSPTIDGRRRQGDWACARKEVTIAADEGIRADTTYEGDQESSRRFPGGVIAAGNASQFSDGAGARAS